MRYPESGWSGGSLDHLQDFLMGLGRGFCFRLSRQKRITVGADHFHRPRLLRTRILTVLRPHRPQSGLPFKPADAGQMNFYLNWMKEQEGSPDDNPPVGILPLRWTRNELYVKYATHLGMEPRARRALLPSSSPDPGPALGGRLAGGAFRR